MNQKIKSMKTRKAIFYTLFAFTLVVIGLISILNSYIIQPHTPKREIYETKYDLGLGSNKYLLEIKNIQSSIDYTNPIEKFTIPYIILSKNHNKQRKPYIIYLRGGPLSVNKLLSFRHLRNYDQFAFDYIENSFSELIDNFNIIYIDDRVNNIDQVLNCNTVEVPWSDYFNMDYSVNLRCNKKINVVKRILDDKSDVNDIKKILDKEGINKAHFIGESFGARRAISFMKDYPQIIKSLTFFHGDIYPIKDEQLMGKAKDNIFNNLDKSYTNSIYQWPFSLKPSKLAKQFDSYLKQHIQAQDYFHIVGENNNYPNIGYIPLKNSFHLLLSEKNTLYLPKKSKGIIKNNYDNLRDLRLCDTYQRDYSSELQYDAIKYYIHTICNIDKAYIDQTNYNIPNNIPVQIIDAGLDRRVLKYNGEPPIFNSSNMGVVSYQDAEHGDCQADTYKDVVLPFLQRLAPINSIKICNYPFYDAMALDDDDLFNPNIVPAIKRRLF